MGGFLVRFPKLKIHMLWYMLIFRIRFKAPAYWLLPMWLFMEVSYGSLFGQASGVAHWAHVGGVLLGDLAAVALQHPGPESKANGGIDKQIRWAARSAVRPRAESMHDGT